jgi:hypothetical protein
MCVYIYIYIYIQEFEYIQISVVYMYKFLSIYACTHICACMYIFIFPVLAQEAVFLYMLFCSLLLSLKYVLEICPCHSLQLFLIPGRFLSRGMVKVGLAFKCCPLATCRKWNLKGQVPKQGGP